MKTSSAKAKGRRAAKLVAESIQGALGASADDVRVTPSGVTGPDIQLSSDVQDRLGGIEFEVKNVEKLNVWKAIRQAKGHTKEDRSWCLIFTRNHDNLYAVVDWDLLLKLIIEHGGRRNEHLYDK